MSTGEWEGSRTLSLYGRSDPVLPDMAQGVWESKALHLPVAPS